MDRPERMAVAQAPSVIRTGLGHFLVSSRFAVGKTDRSLSRCPRRREANLSDSRWPIIWGSHFPYRTTSGLWPSAAAATAGAVRFATGRTKHPILRLPKLPHPHDLPLCRGGRSDRSIFASDVKCSRETTCGERRAKKKSRIKADRYGLARE